MNAASKRTGSCRSFCSFFKSCCNNRNFNGIIIMEELRKLDQVAYVRFASVYREFKDLSSFMSELETLMKNGKTEGTDSKNDQN